MDHDGDVPRPCTTNVHGDVGSVNLRQTPVGIRGPQDAPRGPKRPQEAQEAQETRGASKGSMKTYGGPGRRPRGTQGGPRRFQEASEGPRSTRTCQRAAMSANPGLVLRWASSVVSRKHVWHNRPAWLVWQGWSGTRAHPFCEHCELKVKASLCLRTAVIRFPWCFNGVGLASGLLWHWLDCRQTRVFGILGSWGCDDGVRRSCKTIVYDD